MKRWVKVGAMRGIRGTVVGLGCLSGACSGRIAIGVGLDSGAAPQGSSPVPEASTVQGSDAANETGCSTATTGGFSVASATLVLGGTNPTDYTATLDTSNPIDGSSAMELAATSAASTTTWAEVGAGAPVQSSAWGKRYRMVAELKTDRAQAAWIWFRIDTPTGEVLDNMQQPIYRPIVGTTDWQEVASVLDVPEQATDFAFGVGVTGAGTAWVGPITVGEVQACVPTTPHNGP